MERSEKNFLERLADAVPGLSGYRAREDRRTTDKRLRDYLAGRLDRVRDRLDALKLDLTNKGNLGALNDLGLMGRKLQTATETLRFASYGYSGMFDQMKIRENELDALYTHDLKLLDAADAVDAAIGAPDPAPKAILSSIDALEKLLADRKTLWDKPSHDEAGG
jgi:hypothetical protein